MEKEIYFNLSDNYDLKNLTCRSMEEVAQHIEVDIANLEPEDRDNVVYTIVPILLTQKEYEDLGEYQF